MNTEGASKLFAVALLLSILLPLSMSVNLPSRLDVALVAPLGAALSLPADQSPSAPIGYLTSESYWYVGAQVDSSSSNSGVRSEIEVKMQNVSAFLAFWISDTMSNNLWGQVGYFIFHDSQPLAFYQVWNLTTRTEIASGQSSVHSGFHLFTMSLKEGTTWVFSVDSAAIGCYDMRTNTSNPNAPISALSEEGYTSAPFPFTKVTFKKAVQVLQFGEWRSPSSAESYGNSWGLVGKIQDGSISFNEISVGWNLPHLQDGTNVWE